MAPLKSITIKFIFSCIYLNHSVFFWSWIAQSSKETISTSFPSGSWRNYFLEKPSVSKVDVPFPKLLKRTFCPVFIRNQELPKLRNLSSQLATGFLASFLMLNIFYAVKLKRKPFPGFLVLSLWQGNSVIPPMMAPVCKCARIIRLGISSKYKWKLLGFKESYLKASRVLQDGTPKNLVMF